jgi:putative endonuclease
MDIRDTTNIIGQKAEENACFYLQKHGLRLLTKNYRCALGEIDLIMQDQQEIVFVEVRTRKNPYHATAIESVDFHKQKKIISTATHFLSHKKMLDKVNCRFDVIGISYDQLKAKIEWIKDAFHADNF